MLRCALYARYSSDNQRDASIEDQIRLCREHAEIQDWQVVESYADHATSGANLLRPGVQRLLADALAGKFAIILAESLDRLSRDQEDTAAIFKRLGFAGVKIVTLSEGEITELHVGLKGTMNALYLKDLADKTRRGLRGRIEAGKSGGGNAYGYQVVHALGADGQLMRGDRKIDSEQATVIRRIFKEYADGLSPRAIALSLNQEGVSGPTGKAWGPSTINGNRQRGTSILNNEMYVGRLVCNRLRYVKDPETGKRISRPNPEDKWVIQDVPNLRIVEQELWDKVKARQAKLDASSQKIQNSNWGDRRRPQISVLRPDEVRRVRWRCCYLEPDPHRLRQCPQQRHLFEQAHHTSRSPRSRRARRPAASSDGPGSDRGVLQGVHGAHEPASERTCCFRSWHACRARQDRTRDRSLDSGDLRRRARQQS